MIMGCGRVGASLATILDAQGHSVAVIDSDSNAFLKTFRAAESLDLAWIAMP